MITEREEKLWGLLDDIDTLSDFIKPNDLVSYQRFFDLAIVYAEKRHDVLYSDGYRLHESYPLYKQSPQPSQPIKEKQQ